MNYATDRADRRSRYSSADCGGEGGDGSDNDDDGSDDRRKPLQQREEEEEEEEEQFLLSRQQPQQPQQQHPPPHQLLLLWKDFRGAQRRLGAGESAAVGDRDVGRRGGKRRRHRQHQQHQQQYHHHHALLGRTLRDVGWNRHATFHFGRAWIESERRIATRQQQRQQQRQRQLRDDRDFDEEEEEEDDDRRQEEEEDWRQEAEAAGDYAQAAELAGWPEIGFLALLAYRRRRGAPLPPGSGNDGNGGFDDDDEDDDDDDEGFAAAAGRGSCGGGADRNTADEDDDDAEEEDAKALQFWNRLRQEPSGPAGDCGCGSSDCGSSPCFLPPPMMTVPAVGPVLECIRLYCCLLVREKEGRDGGDSFRSGTPPTTAHALLCRYHRLRNDKRRNQNNDGKGQRAPEDLSALLRTQQLVPELLQFWRCDDDGRGGGKFRPLPQLLQLLLLKLSYLTIPRLACYAVVHTEEERFAGEQPQLPKNFKSHWAYYVLIRSLVLGSRVKPARRRAVPYYHVPVWDLLHGLDRRADYCHCGAVDSSDEKCTELTPADTFERTHDSPRSDTSESSFPDRLRRLVGFLAAATASDHAVTVPPSVQDLCWSRHSDDPEPIYIVGDSHVLSLAWQTVRIPIAASSPATMPNSTEEVSSPSAATITRVAVPVVVTGLKAWHCRPDTRYFTRTNLIELLARRLPRRTRTIVLSAGEIDCREGLGGPRLAGYRESCAGTVERTVREFVASLRELVQLRGSPDSNGGDGLRQVLVMPVAPHASNNQTTGRVLGRISRRETTKEWNRQLKAQLEPIDNVFFLDYVDSVLSPRRQDGCSREEEHRDGDGDGDGDVDYDGYVLNPAISADSTHLNASFARHFERSIAESGCSLDLL